MADPTETELRQALDQAYAAYQLRCGRPRAMDRLRQMLLSDEATGADERWRLLGEVARERVAEMLPPQEAPRKAAE